MAQSLQYSMQYLPAPTLPSPHMIAPHPQHAHLAAHSNLLAPQTQQETQRKRPKYTRSKTGCLTCRGKKIKCDETKPRCQKCAHGQRECTWPEPNPPTKRRTPRSKTKSVSLSNLALRRPSTESESHPSESSSTSRGMTPGMSDTPFNSASFSLPASASPPSERRYSEPQSQTYFHHGNIPSMRRQTLPSITQSQMHNGHSPIAFSPIPDLQSPYHANIPLASAYDSSHGSVSSRSSSRPSTANSLPPSHFATHGAEPAHYHSPARLLPSIDARGHYTDTSYIGTTDPYNHQRWDAISERPPYSQYGTQQSARDFITRQYHQDQNSRF